MRRLGRSQQENDSLMDADVFCSLVNFCDVKDLWLVLLDNLYQLVGEKDGKVSLIGLNRLERIRWCLDLGTKL